MAHIGQESTARSGCSFRFFLGIEQFLGQCAAGGNVLDQLHHPQRRTAGIQNGAERGLHPEHPAMLGAALALLADIFATLQAGPHLRVVHMHFRRVQRKHGKVLAPYFVQAIAQQLQKVLVGAQHMARHVVFHHGLSAVDGGYRALKLCIACLGLGVINQHAVNPAQLPSCVIHATPAFADPADAAISVAQTIFMRIGLARLQGVSHGAVQAQHVLIQQQLIHALRAIKQHLRRPAGQCFHRRTQKQRLPQRMGCTAKGHARNIADQRAVLFLTALQ